MTELHEASMNFDLENVEPFLRRVAAKYEGFDAAEVEALLADISTMAVDSEKRWDFTIRHNDEVTPLQVRVFMDDVDAPDLYFFSSAAVAKELENDLQAFADELGL